ncbi:phospho-sugar mutase [Clostridium estertheticum]|uniref:phospho-sugar mutase n=1 Tax=Clostridium estertheticum TaxID=238834 RepID=UPI001CF5B763|nr:phospho-sugar mutase [Clostridium estertheticum]MCB2306796.1 phospho-sugar mutase [Clostridium estertheticum]MCB2347007.1 phospho-sugar mutase [Clostridium estertheticum]MCB2350302.1 phospho-sugar mutase [Clostridium estertheticum]WAG47270.1 phospho-sugar mutase [Clostridium estertheticum]
MTYIKRYEEWVNNKYFDEETREELKSIKNDNKEIEDRFYMDLEFGTAGLRGKLGAGLNRMNIYIISRATQGLADYIKEYGKEYMDRGVAIAYDCRHYSVKFAATAAQVLAANGIKAYLFEELRPTPELSYAVRTLHTAAGIVVTASHNPKEYNGYKVYWEDGAQILSSTAKGITEKIKSITDFSTIKVMDIEEAKKKGLIVILGKAMDDEYMEKVKGLAIRDNIDKDIKIVYTPLNGTGNVPVRRVLKERGFTNIIVVPEQEKPDPDFTTVGYPNPEDVKAFKYARALGKKEGAELLIATDPDCDRLAIMVRDTLGEYIAFNGNQTGAILIKYVIEGMKENGTLPKNAAIVKSLVTGDLGRAIATKYGVETFEVLTGFKNICGKVNDFKKDNSFEFIFGYEESIGYVAGTFVRDKDAVIASMLLCEAAAYYKSKGKTLLDILNEIYIEFGYYRENLISLVLEGIEGQERISRMMVEYRKDYLLTIGSSKLTKFIDYEVEKSYDILNNAEEPSGIEKSNVLKFYFDDDSWYAVRPSGTEPKIKIYMYSKGKTLKAAEEKLVEMEEVIIAKLQSTK